MFSAVKPQALRNLACAVRTHDTSLEVCFVGLRNDVDQKQNGLSVFFSASSSTHINFSSIFFILPKPRLDAHAFED